MYIIPKGLDMSPPGDAPPAPLCGFIALSRNMFLMALSLFIMYIMPKGFDIIGPKKASDGVRRTAAMATNRRATTFILIS